jgi:hypothetical protein
MRSHSAHEVLTDDVMQLLGDQLRAAKRLLAERRR